MREPVLILHNTAAIFYEDVVGETSLIGRVARNTIYGILMYSSLKVTLHGLPLGLAAVKFRTPASSKAPMHLNARSTSRGTHRQAIRPLLHRHTFRQIPRLIHIRPSCTRRVIRQ